MRSAVAMTVRMQQWKDGESTGDGLTWEESLRIDRQACWYHAGVGSGRSEERAEEVYGNFGVLKEE